MDLDAHGWMALAILVVAVLLFVTKWLPIPVTALSIPVVLYATGVLPDAEDALQGFGNQAALAIAAVFVLGAGLRETGVATLIARGLERVGGRSEVRLVIALMLACGALSAFMSNAAVVAILLPVGVVLSRRSGVATSRLLMPMAFAAVLGGTVTLLGTAPNFLVADFLARTEPDVHLTIFDFARVGVPILVTGVLFMALVGRRMLPALDAEDRLGSAPLPEEVAQSFQVRETLFELLVAPDSTISGLTLTQADIRNRYGLDVLMIYRPRSMRNRWIEPDPDRELHPGDILFAQGEEISAWAFCEAETLQFGLADETSVARILRRGTTLAEVTLPPRSRAIGRTFRDMQFRRRFGLNVIRIWRRGGAVPDSPRDVRLEIGDAFLVAGPAERVRRLGARPDFTVLTDLSESEDVRRAPLAIALLVAALYLSIVHRVPLALAAMGAALLMYATGSISTRVIQRAVDWKVIFLIVGTIPLGMALDRHHVAAIAASWITNAGAAYGPTGVYTILFFVAAAVATLTSNAAAAVIVAPVAARAAVAAGIDLKSALLVMCYGCSCAFLLPFAQCNILVMAPGGYRNRDYLRVGFWMSLVMAVTTIAMFSL
jgi:di/tricarboxylate transporter